MSWEEDSEPNQQLQDQVRQNEMEITQKRANLQKQRMVIVKSFGVQDFTGSGANAPVLGTKPTARM